MSTRSVTIAHEIDFAYCGAYPIRVDRRELVGTLSGSSRGTA